MQVIEYLSKRDSEWREMAFKICGCRILADDLTNDMYIRMHKYWKKPTDKLSDFYIWRVIRSRFMNHIKESGRFDLSLHNITDSDEAGTISEEREYSMLREYYEEEEAREEALEKRKELNEALDKLHWYDAELLLLTKEISMRQLSRETGISLASIHHTCKVSREQLKQILICQDEEEGQHPQPPRK